MNIDYNALNIHALNWMLIMTRISFFFFAAPFFGSQAINKTVKSFIIAMLAYFIYTSGMVTPILEIPTMGILFILMAKEMVIGVVLTSLAFMVYQPVRIIGVQVGRSAGLGRARMFNPEENTQFTVVQQMLYIVGILIFLGLNGHHIILRVIAISFKYIPIGNVYLNGKIVEIIINFFSKGFSLGLQCAAPIMSAILISSLCFGILGKTVPQMNLLILGLPIRVFIAMMGLFFALPIIGVVYQKFIVQSERSLMELVYIMSRGVR